MVIERQDASGDDQYLLRLVTKALDGRYILKATNPDYPDYEADESMRTLARLDGVLSPADVTLTDRHEFEQHEYDRPALAALFCFLPGIILETAVDRSDVSPTA